MQRPFVFSTILLLTLQIHAKVPNAESICPVLFEGRVPPFLEKTAFDTAEIPFYSIKPLNVLWSTLLGFPAIQPSLFDREFGGKALELGINDQSIIINNSGIRQTGYRRTELVANDDADTATVRTYHWSVKQGKALNLLHEYVNVYLERRDGSGNDFAVSLGGLLGAMKPNWSILDKNRAVIWQTPLLQNEWQNFAITVNYTGK
jgi:hypothetical protein